MKIFLSINILKKLGQKCQVFLVNCIHNKDQKLHLCKFLAEIIEFLARITAQKAYPDT